LLHCQKHAEAADLIELKGSEAFLALRWQLLRFLRRSTVAVGVPAALHVANWGGGAAFFSDGDCVLPAATIAHGADAKDFVVADGAAFVVSAQLLVLCSPRSRSMGSRGWCRSFSFRLTGPGSRRSPSPAGSSSSTDFVHSAAGTVKGDVAVCLFPLCGLVAVRIDLDGFFGAVGAAGRSCSEQMRGPRPAVTSVHRNLGHSSHLISSHPMESSEEHFRKWSLE
jgi:hypothetical protein